MFGTCTVFPLIRALGAYLISKIEGAALKGRKHLFQGKKNYSPEISKLVNFLF